MNLVTGLLGTGKTSALCHLLRQIPVGEHWAVVVNKFGALGIDAGVLTGEVSAAHRDNWLELILQASPGDKGGDPDWVAFEQALLDCRVPEQRVR